MAIACPGFQWCDCHERSLPQVLLDGGVPNSSRTQKNVSACTCLHHYCFRTPVHPPYYRFPDFNWPSIKLLCVNLVFVLNGTVVVFWVIIPVSLNANIWLIGPSGDVCRLAVLFLFSWRHSRAFPMFHIMWERLESRRLACAKKCQMRVDQGFVPFLIPVIRENSSAQYCSAFGDGLQQARWRSPKTRFLFPQFPPIWP